MTNSGKEDKERLSEEQLFDFAAYVLTSAKGLYREPHGYGPMRMVDSLEKAIELMKNQGIESQELEEAMDIVRENRWQATSNTQEFAETLDKAIHKLVLFTMK
ncbi:DUF6092 family protein [Evansella halocellulosilytica]|uniref:DUF6092 family protein n=1 Tax=Evansella halocellulosilytica TaxID=2011013 RepID=UPI000BB9ABBF|nr:DUF6092 family protein [Evansella halocellulosilytica]